MILALRLGSLPQRLKLSGCDLTLAFIHQRICRERFADRDRLGFSSSRLQSLHAGQQQVSAPGAALLLRGRALKDSQSILEPARSSLNAGDARDAWNSSLPPICPASSRTA